MPYTKSLYKLKSGGLKKIDIVVKLHKKLLKYNLKVKMTTYNNLCVGRYPLCIALKKIIIGFCGRLLEHTGSKLSRVIDNLCLIYITLLYSIQYVSPWVLQNKQLLDDCLTYGSQKWNIRRIRQMLSSSWKTNSYQSGKLCLKVCQLVICMSLNRSLRCKSTLFYVQTGYL